MDSRVGSRSLASVKGASEADSNSGSLAVGSTVDFIVLFIEKDELLSLEAICDVKNEP